MAKYLILLALAFVFGCEGDRSESPTAPEVLEFGEGAAIPEPPAEGEESPEVPVENPDEAPTGEGGEAPPEDQAEPVLLEVVALEQLPQRIAECVQQGIAGEVVNGMFTCNQQVLIDCNDLSEAQKSVAKKYAADELAGYSLYGCSNSAEGNPNLHYFMVDGVALRIFNLEVQRSEPGQG
ncbi:MAG: hypothetical protein ACOH5I_09690 [Oligoflexus sp.]